jgi:hypothetical protein
MTSNYEKIILENLTTIYHTLSEKNLEEWLPARRSGRSYEFQAFGETCRIGPEELTVSGRPERGPKGLIISLYVLHAKPDPLILAPLKSFKDFPGSMPYQGAFIAHTERPLVPRVVRAKAASGKILEAFHGKKGVPGKAGDFSFLLFPFPKIALGYIFYLPDEDFPPSVTCLYSANAQRFMPLDGLADVAEYTSRKIIELIGQPS